TIDVQSGEDDWKKVGESDVAIEFSNPQSAVKNIRKCFELNTPVVVGTTGWYHEYEQIKNDCEKAEQSLLSATNFSIGVNLFFHLNKILAQAMENLPEYNVEIEETHHIAKLDAPSGTAITLAEGILAEVSRKLKWELSDKAKEDDISITAHRRDDIPGTHIIRYTSEIDDIEIQHRAHSRSGFATGAVVAAEWLFNAPKGTYTM